MGAGVCALFHIIIAELEQKTGFHVVGAAVYVWLVDSRCLRYDEPCWIAVVDGVVETGDDTMTLNPHHQHIGGGQHYPQPHPPCSMCLLDCRSSLLAHVIAMSDSLESKNGSRLLSVW